MKLDRDIDRGEIRGLCWRANNCLSLYDEEHVSELNNTRFMCVMTHIIDTSTSSTNEYLYYVLNCTVSRLKGDFWYGCSNSERQQNIKKCVLERKICIFENILCPEVRNINGHACMKIEEVIVHHLAPGCDLDFPIDPVGMMPMDARKK